MRMRRETIANEDGAGVDVADAEAFLLESFDWDAEDDDARPPDRLSLSLVLGEKSFIRSGHMRSFRMKHISGF